MASTLDWLRERSDDDLAGLLCARPELIVPVPPDLASLARRLDGDAAGRRAASRRNAFEMQILQALWILGPQVATDSRDSPDSSDSSDSPGAAGRVGASPISSASTSTAPTDTPPAGITAAARSATSAASAAPFSTSAEDIAGLLGGPATSRDVESAARNLETAGIIRDVDDGYVLPEVSRRALGQFPAGLGEPGGLTVARARSALSSVSPDGLAILRRLVPGPPVGTIEPGSSHSDTVAGLVAAHLLARTNSRTVVLPREVALALRGDQPLGPAIAAAPALTPHLHRPGTVDRTAAGQALLARSRAIAVLGALGADPAAALKSGGIGITALRRLAKSLELDTGLVALYLELLHGLALIAPMVLSTGGNVRWAPTRDAEEFREQSDAMAWARLAVCWLDSRRDPALAGSPDAEGSARNVLSSALDWRDGPSERRRILREIIDLPVDSGTTDADLIERLRYRRPMSDPRRLARNVTTVLAEATELGLVAFHGLSGVGKSAIHAETGVIADALDAILPEPVDRVIVQGDMTIVAPGHTTRALATFLDHVAQPESTGSASVYRLTESSIRHALDVGFTAEKLHELFSQYSSTALPQAVTYLIDDVARRHGVLRAGDASSFVRSDDPAIITQAVVAAQKAGIDLRALAPTVAVSLMDLPVLIETLRAAGLAPAAEDASGGAMDLRTRPRRAPFPAHAQPRFTEPGPPSHEHITAAVKRMRAGDNFPGKASQPVDVMTLLKEASYVRDKVWIGYASTEGVTSTRLVEPIVVSGGTMVAYDKLRDAPRTFSIHRITSAHLADSTN